MNMIILTTTCPIDDDDFDPEAGFQKEEKKNEWEGEDEGLDVAVRLICV